MDEVYCRGGRGGGLKVTFGYSVLMKQQKSNYSTEVPRNPQR